MDRWNYARDEHPAYCTCVECVDENKKGGRKGTRRSFAAGRGSFLDLIISWVKRLFRGR